MALRIAALSSTMRIFADSLTAGVCDREGGKEILRVTHFNCVELLNSAQVTLHRLTRVGNKRGVIRGRSAENQNPDAEDSRAQTDILTRVVTQFHSILINTALQCGGHGARGNRNRFNGFCSLTPGTVESDRSRGAP